MNIFKILGNGHGSINEPNVNAFIGYLLAPYEDHGLGTSFLKRFLTSLDLDDDLSSSEDETINNLYRSSHLYRVFFEQEFIEETEESKSKIVDIILVEYKIKNAEQAIGKKRQAFKDFFSSTPEATNIYLIEVKINEGAKTNKQIEEQYKATKSVLSNHKIEGDIKTIYLTPDSTSYKDEFESSEIGEKYHLKWPILRETISDLLMDESKGDIEPIDNYIKHTLKAFATFIENGFKSEVKEKERRSNYVDIKYDIESFLQDYENLFTRAAVEKISGFKKYIDSKMNEFADLSIRHSKTHPCSVFYKGKKIFSLSARGKNLRVVSYYTNYDIRETKDYSDNLSSDFKGYRELNENEFEWRKLKNLNEIKRLFEFNLKRVISRY